MAQAYTVSATSASASSVQVVITTPVSRHVRIIYAYASCRQLGATANCLRFQTFVAGGQGRTLYAPGTVSTPGAMELAPAPNAGIEPRWAGADPSGAITINFATIAAASGALVTSSDMSIVVVYELI